MKQGLMIAAGVLLLALVAGGSFWGGIAYQTNKANQIQANFLDARGPGDGAQFPGMGQMPQGGQGNGGPMSGGQAGGPGALGGGGTSGQVKSIDGNVLTLSTAQEVTTVTLSESTQVEKNVTTTVSDLQPGIRVMVVGEKGKDGTITASQIRILESTAAGGSYPAPAEQEP